MTGFCPERQQLQCCMGGSRTLDSVVLAVVQKGVCDLEFNICCQHDTPSTCESCFPHSIFAIQTSPWLPANRPFKESVSVWRQAFCRTLVRSSIACEAVSSSLALTVLLEVIMIGSRHRSCIRKEPRHHVKLPGLPRALMAERLMAFGTRPSRCTSVRSYIALQCCLAFTMH